MYVIGIIAPAQFAKMIVLARDDEDFRKALVAVLPIQTNQGLTILHLIAELVPQELAWIIELADNDENFHAALAMALPTAYERSGGITAFHAIAQNAPSQLVRIITLAETHADIRNALVLALPVQHQNSMTALYEIARRAPDQFARIIALAQKYDAVRTALANALLIKDEIGQTVLHVIAWVAPNALPEIITGMIALANTDITMLFALAAALRAKPKDAEGKVYDSGLQAVKVFANIHFDRCADILIIDGYIRSESPDSLKYAYRKLDGGLFAMRKIFADKNSDEILITLNEQSRKDPGGASSKLLDQLLKKYIHLSTAELDLYPLKKEIVELINTSQSVKKSGSGFFLAYSQQDTSELIKQIDRAKSRDEIKTTLENEMKKVSGIYRECLNRCIQRIEAIQVAPRV